MGIWENLKKSTFLLGALAVLVTAGLVAYLSQAAMVTTQVKSPIELTFTDAPEGATISNDGLLVTMPEAIGGSTYDFLVKFKNKANNPISNMKTTLACVEEGEPIECEALDIEVTADVGLPSQQTYTAPCADGVWTVSEPTQPVPAGYESDNEVSVTIAPNYVGGLSCKLQTFYVAE